jgi:hypothetical protein
MTKEKAKVLVTQALAILSLFAMGSPRLRSGLAILQRIVDGWDDVWELLPDATGPVAMATPKATGSEPDPMDVFGPV